MREHGCFYGNDMASVLYHSKSEPISLDIPRRIQPFILADVKDAKKKMSRSKHLAETEVFIKNFYGFQNTREINLEVRFYIRLNFIYQW